MFKRTLTLAVIMAFGTIGFAQSGTQTTGAQTPPPKPDAAKSKTLTAVQGVWVFTSVNGQDATGQAEIVITITDDKYVQTIDGNVVEKGTLKFDDTKKPIYMDLVIVEGQDAGKTQLGVFELTSPTAARAKLNTAGETTRPTDFAPAPGEGYFVFTAVKKK
jgi:uncharacterized protein (TIGR03067 family)